MPSQLSTFFSKPRNVIRVVAVVLLAAGTYGQLMLRGDSQPVAESNLYDVAMTFTTPAGQAFPRVQVRAGQTVSVAIDDKRGKLSAAFVLTPAGKDAVTLVGGFGCGGASAKLPAVTARLGEPTAMTPPADSAAPGCALVMVVTKLAELGSAR